MVLNGIDGTDCIKWYWMAGITRYWMVSDGMSLYQNVFNMEFRSIIWICTPFYIFFHNLDHSMCALK